MTSSANSDLRLKALQIYEYISEYLYLNRPDLTINNKKFNTALLMSLLAGLGRGKVLVIGEPGLGKTTFTEYVGSLVHRIPLGIIWGAQVSGHPEQTEEKIVGRPDLGKLNSGEEVVIWSHFTQLPVKIVDEINRLPETKQSIILNGVDRGNWEYLNDTVISREYCLFATANYQDRGTNTMIAPLMDRFDVMVESRHPGANLAGVLGETGCHESILRHKDLEKAFQKILHRPLDDDTRRQKLDELSDEFDKYLSEQTEIPGFTSMERYAVIEQKNQIPFDMDFNAFLRMVISEFSFCHQYGQKRSNDTCEAGCHFTGYLCSKTKNCLSNRFPKSVRNLSQTLAWLLGDQTTGLHHLEAVLPFALAHRIQWRDQVVAESEKAFRNDPVDIHMAKNAVQKMLRQYREQAQQIQQALATACRIAEGEALEPVIGDHPIFHEIVKDLE